MDKSSHRSRKRKRSLSRDHLAGLEELSRLISVLSEREVRTPCVPLSLPPLSSFLAYQGSSIDSLSEEFVRKNNREINDPHDSGIYEHPNSVNKTGESTQFSNRNTFSSFTAVTGDLSDREPLPAPSPAKIILEESAISARTDIDEFSANTLGRELFDAE